MILVAACLQAVVQVRELSIGCSSHVGFKIFEGVAPHEKDVGHVARATLHACLIVYIHVEIYIYIYICGKFGVSQ